MSKFTQIFPKTTTDEFWVVLYEWSLSHREMDCYLTNSIDMTDPDCRYQPKPQYAARFASEAFAKNAIEILGHTGPGNGFLPPKAVKVTATTRTDYTVHLG